jgi:hypothetical protein
MRRTRSIVKGVKVRGRCWSGAVRDKVGLDVFKGFTGILSNTYSIRS